MTVKAERDRQDWALEYSVWVKEPSTNSLAGFVVTSLFFVPPPNKRQNTARRWVQPR